MEVKTAKDLPPGSEVEGRHNRWVKGRPGRNECWTDRDGNHFSDGQIDRLIGDGAFLTFVPSGRGRWLAKEQAERATGAGREWPAAHTDKETHR